MLRGNIVPTRFSEVTMKSQGCARQRPLFHDGPAWQQLCTEVQQQIVHRLADLCCEIVNQDTPEVFPADQEQPHDRREN